MVADTDQGLLWLVWLSPLGWVEESRPLTDPNLVALLPVLVLLIAVTAVTLHLTGARDAGAASWPGRDLSKPHLALLGGSAGLAVRLMRPVALGWLFAVAVFAVLIGTTAESSAKDATGSQGITTGSWTHPSSSTWFPPPPRLLTGRAWRSSPASGS
jgi:ABC-2 type transport system permease protein